MQTKERQTVGQTTTINATYLYSYQPAKLLDIQESLLQVVFKRYSSREEIRLEKIALQAANSNKDSFATWLSL